MIGAATHLKKPKLAPRCPNFFSCFARYKLCFAWCAFAMGAGPLLVCLRAKSPLRAFGPTAALRSLSVRRLGVKRFLFCSLCFFYLPRVLAFFAAVTVSHQFLPSVARMPGFDSGRAHAPSVEQTSSDFYGRVVAAFCQRPIKSVRRRRLTPFQTPNLVVCSLSFRVGNLSVSSIV